MSSIFTVLIALLWPPAPAQAIEDRRENSGCFACDYSKYADRRDPVVQATDTLRLGFIQTQNWNTPLASALGADDLRSLGGNDVLRNDYVH
jgi:hypothetical protein